MPFKTLYYIQATIVKILKFTMTAAIAIVLSFLVIMWNMRTQPINITPYMVSVQQKTNIKPKQTWIPLDSISPEVIKAVIACEDNNFFYHFGFDIEAIKNAMQRNQNGKKLYGASTITQQMIKNVFLSHQRTWIRKAAELGLSVLAELMWGKARIIEVYLNVIETGANIYGIEAAAQHYFHKKAIELNQHDAVMIALALPNPKKYNPARPSKYMNNRYEQICVMIDKLMKYGWYKDVKNIKEIKVNYLENYPSPPHEINNENKNDAIIHKDTIYIRLSDEIVEVEDEDGNTTNSIIE
jgi:monofunctional biosynthetic peptidoglycan transglycosylase